MPAAYTRIRDYYKKKGKSAAISKKLAAMTFNSHRPKGTPPVTRKSK